MQTHRSTAVRTGLNARRILVDTGGVTLGLIRVNLVWGQIAVADVVTEAESPTAQSLPFADLVRLRERVSEALQLLVSEQAQGKPEEGRDTQVLAGQSIEEQLPNEKAKERLRLPAAGGEPEDVHLVVSVMRVRDRHSPRR